jgi:dihydropteroate synthase
VILARRVFDDSPGVGLASAFARMGLPAAAGSFIRDTAAPQVLLLTGLEKVHGKWLKGLQASANDAPGREAWPVFVTGNQGVRPGTAMLVGRQEQFERLVTAVRKDPALTELEKAVVRAVAPERPQPVTLDGKRFEWGARTYLMGVVNVTPDSFSDGGEFLAPEKAIAQGQALAAAGADLLDVGGESTRPGAAEVSAQDELARVIPVIEGLRKACPGVPISIDTTKPAVAEAALAAGACLVNDVTAFGHPQMAGVVAKAGAACCLMHMQGTPRTMQSSPTYEDVVEEIFSALEDAALRAVAAGVPREKIWVDPGIGFGKTVEHNVFLLKSLGDFRQLGLALLLGTSRKSFLGKLTGGKPPQERVYATAATVAIAAAQGAADVVRVHDVAACLDAVKVGDAVRLVRDGGGLFTSAKKSGV